MCIVLVAIVVLLLLLYYKVEAIITLSILKVDLKRLKKRQFLFLNLYVHRVYK